MARTRFSIEIAASPAEVRSVILDFPHYTSWQSYFAPHTLPPPPSQISISKSQNEVSWRMTSSRKYYAQFFESHITPGGTTFVHGEIREGCMAWVYRDGWAGVRRKGMEKKLGVFGKGVKRRVEDLREKAVRVESEQVLEKM